MMKVIKKFMQISIISIDSYQSDPDNIHLLPNYIDIGHLLVLLC